MVIPDQNECAPLVGVEQSPAAHWLVDERLHFLSARGRDLPIFRRPLEQVAGQSILGVLPVELADAWASRIRRALDGETVLVREHSGAHAFAVTFYPVRTAAGVAAGGLAQEITAIAAADLELRNAAVRVMKNQEQERARLARFLHDDISQSLSAAGLQLDLVRMDYEASVPGIAAQVLAVQHSLDEIMRRLRDFSFELNPGIVERAGLHTALDLLAGRTRSRFSGKVRLMIDPAARVPTPAGAALYKIADEAVENAVMHSGCTAVEVLLKSTRLGAVLEIQDNGKGFDVAAVFTCGRGLGLIAMEHYAREAHVRLHVSSTPGAGTVVSAVYSGEKNM